VIFVDVYKNLVDESCRRVIHDLYGYDESNFCDDSPIVRIGAYKELGWKEQAKHDSFWYIRFRAYTELGWTAEALFDQEEDLVDVALYHLGYIIKEEYRA
jgi:hypothetical protein